jgi:predicted Zn-dependent protease
MIHSGKSGMKRRWQKLVLLGALSLVSLVLSVSSGAQSLHQLLEKAVQEQNWDQALDIVDLLIQVETQRRSELEAYRSQLLDLQGKSPTEIPPEAGFQPQVLPMPSGLTKHVDPNGSGDYFSAIDPLLGEKTYLRWADFPVRVYIPPVDSKEWLEWVKKAISEWSPYIHLEIVGSRDSADIIIDLDETGTGIAGHARASEFYQAFDGTLQHRVQIVIAKNPKGGLIQVYKATLHELGHALGLWGHSPERTDIMFASVQVRSKITARDLNTLKKVYEQPTYIGLKVPEDVMLQVTDK